MDYTTLEIVKSNLRITADTDDALISSLITYASRAIDRRCTGQPGTEAHNYFALETVSNEELYANINRNGCIVCIPHKPSVQSVSEFWYRENITKEWASIAVARCDIVGSNKIMAYPTNLSIDFPARCRVKISYIGGFSGSAAGLPEDLIELTTLLTARLYREYETGLNDVVGVPDVANQLVYTKAWPVRLQFQLETFIRKEGWEYPS